jgi:NADPH:quinone reductase-like Zn-dependent oxidoreductase
VTGYPRCAATGGGRQPVAAPSSAPHRRYPHGNLTLDGVLVRPSRAVLEVLAAAVADGSLRPVVDQVLELADAAVAHRRVESRRGQGKVVLRVAR